MDANEPSAVDREMGLPPASPPIFLSRREREVAILLAQGLPNQRIAETLRIGRRTAESHVTRLFKKLGVTSRAQAMLWVLAALPPGPRDTPP